VLRQTTDGWGKGPRRPHGLRRASVVCPTAVGRGSSCGQPLVGGLAVSAPASAQEGRAARPGAGAATRRRSPRAGPASRAASSTTSRCPTASPTTSSPPTVTASAAGRPSATTTTSSPSSPLPAGAAATGCYGSTTSTRTRSSSTATPTRPPRPPSRSGSSQDAVGGSVIRVERRATAPGSSGPTAATPAGSPPPAPASG
jgi:hypothetical protein